MTEFIRGEMYQREQYGFSVLLAMAAIVRMIGYKLKLSCIAESPQEHSRSRLIINLSKKTNEGTPSFNDTPDMEVAPESI